MSDTIAFNTVTSGVQVVSPKYPLPAAIVSSNGFATDAGSHAYTYSAGNLITDAWTVGGVTKTKTYTYTAGVLTAESDWA